MSVAEELNKNIANLAASYTAVSQTGMVLPEQRNFDNLPVTIGSIDAAEASGVPPLTMKSVSDYPARDYRIYGDSVQDGTPTPSAPQEIESVGDLVTSGTNSGKYRIPITMSGKNLFSGFTKGIALAADNGNQATNADGAASDYIPVDFERHPYYVLSGLTNRISSFVAAYNSNKQFLGRTSDTEQTNKLLGASVFGNGTPQGSGAVAYVRVAQYVTINSTGTIDDIDDLRVQLETGSTATSYEPYHIPETTNIILDEPLRKIGDYADQLDFKNGKITRKIKAIQFDGSENWGLSGSQPATGRQYYLSTFATDYGLIQDSSILSNRFRERDGAEWGAERSTGDTIASRSQLFVIVNSASAPNLVAFKQWLADNPTTFNAVLAAPTNTAVSLPALPRWAGTVTVGVDTKVQPSEVFVKF